MKNNLKKILLAVVAVIAVAAYFRYFAQEAPKEKTESISTSDQKLEVSDPQAARVGSPAPQFDLKDSYGNNYNLKKLLGEKPILVIFETTWCTWCRKELKDIEKFNETYRDKILVLTIDIGENQDTVKSWVEKNNIKRPWLLDTDEKISNTYLASGTPNHVLINKKGTIIYRWPGFASWNMLEKMAEEAI